MLNRRWPAQQTASGTMNRVIGAQFLRNLVERRNLLFQLAKRDFRQRYIGSAAGWLWGLVHPLVMLGSWTFVFQYCLKSELPPGSPTSNYTFFLLAGYLPWMLFQETVTRSSNSLLENANLITKTLFPSEMLPISVFFSSAANHLLGLSLSIAAIAIWDNGVSPFALLLPVYMLFIGFFGVGIGWVFASLQVYLRDTAQLVIVLLTFWFWMTPIFITEDKIPENMRFLIRENPMSMFVRSYRDRLFTLDWPNPGELAILAAWSFGAFLAGGLFFRHLKRGFADVL
jgi:ABC-type polysaccharide/polyol phosphate export permease